ncbi:FCPB [Symbiodinium natans]|uniref:FCPB protein n=1 Tax=Symbiodinium natans TaxID=878477 RepID=A0A812IJL2_9DINO|nr:FCPB [Symbiodinium natans]
MQLYADALDKIKFLGASSSKFTTALRAFEQELGVQPPVGFWDPLGLSRDGDVENFMRRRSVELKHGRIAMLATMGYITPEIAGKFPGYLSPSLGLKFADVPNGLAALSKVPGGGWTQILLYMGWCEVSRGAGSDIASGRPGDFGWYVLTSADPEAKNKKLNAELANGRLAMMAIIGMFYQDGLTGSAWGDWANFTESPLRAFEQELGVQPPVGFWDPLGLARDGDVDTFMRRRSVELKHGRIAMLADPAKHFPYNGRAESENAKAESENAQDQSRKQPGANLLSCATLNNGVKSQGYITPEIAGKFPGYLSPSLGLKFADVPNGLAAISKVPAGGWTQILFYMGWCEVSRGAGSDIASGRPGDFGWYVLTSEDPEAKNKKLNAELANGRLAMMAIIGMFYQDGLTGSAWGDWANFTESPLRAAAPDFSTELGVTPPLGFWDPLGLSKFDDPEIAAQQFRRRRIVELQHGRVAMLACLGYITPEYVRFPGFCSPSQSLAFTDIPNGLKGAAAVPLAGWLQIVTFVGIIEVYNLQTIQTDILGDYGYGAFGIPFGKKIEDAEKKTKSLNAEINNGRLAMMAIIGMFFQDGLTGSAWGDWANYADSPLRATAPDFSTELGVTPPLGFFDPLGLSKFDDPEVAAAQFKRRRIIEIQHGRVAMLACIGYIVPEYTRFPGFCSPSQSLSFTDIPNGLKGAAVVPLAGWLQIVTFVGIIEVYNLQTVQTDVLGDYGYGAFGLPFGKKIEDAEKKTKSLNAELNNGRLAMMAIIGMFFQDGLTGSAWGDWANYADSPLRAFEEELGVQPPVGFWDPVGYTRDGNADTFKRRRETEIKHGRVAMYATMGYIVPEYFKWPGFLSPSLGLKFSDVPNGLAAITKVPGAGWAQIVAFAGYYELSVYKYSGTPGDYGWKPITSSDPETLKKKLSAEIANGRLAMQLGSQRDESFTPKSKLKPIHAGDSSNENLLSPAFCIAFCMPMQLQDETGVTVARGKSVHPELQREALSGSRGEAAGEEELGVQPPVGFWDPVGYTRDGNADTFKRRRETEIKHGRVAMYATMGYIVPEYFKWPGFLSPSLGLKFSDVPNGLAAITKVPGAGWAQIVAFAGYYELSVYKYSGTPGDYGWKPITSSDPETLKKKPLDFVEHVGLVEGYSVIVHAEHQLSAEIANGRMAIIGMFFQEELGVQPPVGFWDPVGYTRDGNADTFKRRRETEIKRLGQLKHGRVAMYATMGCAAICYIVPEYFKWPGFLSPSLGLKFSDVPNGLAAITKVPGAGWAQIVAFAGYYELSVYKYSGTPGDYGWKPITSSDPETLKKKLSAEIANGRLAMMAIIGMFFQDGLTGSAWGDWATYTDSPLRAFEDETGVQPPVGFWDPLGLSASGNLSDFNRRREVELKHGRVSMFATIGYILPEYWRFPGYLSKYLDIKFADMPNGLAAISKVPTFGWLQIVGFAGIVEVNVYNEQIGDEPGNYGAGFLGLRSIGVMSTGIQDPEARKKKLNAESVGGQLYRNFSGVGMALLQSMFSPLIRGAWCAASGGLLGFLAAGETLSGSGRTRLDTPAMAARRSTETFKRRRETELKHGRVAMYATMGGLAVLGDYKSYIVPEYFKWPGPSARPRSLRSSRAVPGAGWAQIVAFAGYYEIVAYKYSGTPGDYGWKPITSSDPEGLKKKLSAELANGRLAMMAIIGMFFQDGLTGSAWGDWATYTDSPLRAFEDETGVQPPVGFWDPLGLSASGNLSDFNRRREVELKHGRVSMFATIGYILPEYWRFPGYLSKYLDIKFADMPNGLAAFSKVPTFGWLQIVGFAGIVEVNVYNEQIGGEPGNYGAGFLGLRSIGVMSTGIQDPEARKKKLNAELANGRLAMMAIIGMFFQDGLTGSAWGDWANYTDSPLRAFEEETGVQPPVGFWDPLGLSTSGNVSDFKRRREVELKHGRVAMFATMGYILPEYWRFPGYLSKYLDIKFADVPNGLSAFSKVPTFGWLQIVGFAGIVEVNVYNEQIGDEPGNYGAGFLGLRSIGVMSTGIQDPEVRKKKLNAELANGRLAMMAIIGMFFQDGLTGSAWGDWSLYTASPLRAFEGELGVQAPVGFWDPLGLSADGDTEVFKRRREVELKHGRISMYAAMGYIVPEYFRWPGELSPKLGLKFTDIPNGLAALTKVPGQGWAQIVAFLGVYELFVNKPVGDEPGNYGKGNLGLGFLKSVADPEARTRKLSAELANGRLAMMAIMGMLFQDGLTGSAWGDWALYTDSPLRAFEQELGAQPPLGFWDPVGFTKDGSAENFKRRRAVEIKHGRIAMLATMGYITPELGKFGGICASDLNFSDIPNGLAALKVVPFAGWLQIFLYCGFVEFSGGLGEDAWGSKRPGDVGWNPPLLSAGDDETKQRRLAAELANGRLAMMAIIGMFFQDGLTGSAWGDWANYTASPLRAFEQELGAQPPLGFWDPVGFTKDGSAENFKRRRAVEIKHGRIAMLATMGYITPELGKFGGICASDLNFSDIPNGLAALKVVPFAGWLQIFLYCGFVEFSGGLGEDAWGSKRPGDVGWNPPLLSAGDDETKQRRLAAELANGRLAMMAIIGMFFQDGLTGSAWGHWAASGSPES